MTFTSPPATAPTKTTAGGRLPFTGLPLAQSVAIAAAFICAGVLLATSRRGHRAE